MDPLISAAASGLQARMDTLDILANNLANAATSGFKADREFYSTYLAPELSNQTEATVGEAPVVQRQWTDFGQGTLAETGNSTDLALSGNGFFAVNGPGGVLYTRSGNFRFSPQGTLVTAEGYPVRLTGGQTLQSQSTDPIRVQPDGQVTQNGVALGQLELADFQDSSQLTKQAGAYFQSSAAPGASTAQVFQGKIESSNFSPSEAAARMVTVLRNFDMLQHAAKLGAEMNRQAVEEVAHVG
jgi:flagellar basal-body rod protein FlgF